jgi:hypothetical protein
MANSAMHPITADGRPGKAFRSKPETGGTQRATVAGLDKK